MAKNYRLVATELDDAWDSFLDASPDASVFMRSGYLAHIGCRLGLYRCYNANELRAVVVLAESPDGSAAVLDDLLIYSGLCYGAPTSRQGRAQRTSERHEIACFIASELADQYPRLEFALSPSITDVRPFQWYRYGEESGRYRIEVRYTSYLEIADFAEATALEEIAAYRDATGARRQQIRYARRDGVVTEEFDDAALFIDFYRKTMVRQGEEVMASKLGRMEGLIAGLLKKGMARLFLSRTAEGVAGSIAVYARDQHRAYYLFGASDPALRETPTGTAVLWDAFGELSKTGIETVDLEGVNSPRRGWFKMSFGGDLRSYYQLCKTSD